MPTEFEGKRRLAAIVCMDVVAYSRLVSADEEGTIARLRTLRREVIDPTVDRHDGRVIKSTGDGVLAEFSSAVEAVRCALDVQRDLGEREAGRVADERMALRIGINLADVIAEPDGDVYGDGVNVAARLEGLANPGGICISRSVRDQVRDRLPIMLEDLGDVSVKNLDRPVRVFAIAAGGSAAPKAAGPIGRASSAASLDSPLPLPNKPSIAVLPFTNLSGDPEQEYFADGMAEEIITGLSRVRWLFVIARNSTFTYKGHAVDVKQVARDLGVRYVLEGSVRKAPDRVRFTVQLIDASSGTHLWADRIEGHLDDVFDLQDRITEKVVASIEPEIRFAEIERAQRKRPENLDAYDLYLRALSVDDQFTRGAVVTMLEYCARAIALDSSFAPAYALSARCYIQKTVQGWLSPADKQVGLELVERGLRAAGRKDADMLAVAGHCYAFLAHDLPGAISLLDDAIDLNPNSAWAFLHSGIVRNFSGDTATALEHLKRALRLSPRDLRAYGIFQSIALTYQLEGRHEEAYPYAKRAVQLNASYLPGWNAVASSAAMLGNQVEAEKAARTALALDSELSISAIKMRYPIWNLTQFEHVFEGLRRAGIPE